MFVGHGCVLAVKVPIGTADQQAQVLGGGLRVRNPCAVAGVDWDGERRSQPGRWGAGGVARRHPGGRPTPNGLLPGLSFPGLPNYSFYTMDSFDGCTIWFVRGRWWMVRRHCAQAGFSSVANRWISHICWCTFNTISVSAHIASDC